MDNKILVVDDELSIRDLFKETLSDDGYNVLLAENGEEALNILRKEQIDVIFLDLRLFGMNGIELCRKIRATKPLSIIYAVTGWAALFEIEECREAGFDDYFAKPVEPKILSKSVKDAFEKLNRWKKRCSGIQK
ncbi:MAG: response regulator [Syntrophales bacterium LBB04]|nr:response regulator [Syntrophales bacterium LBB04]